MIADTNDSSSATPSPSPDQDALMSMVFRMVGDMGAAVSGSLVILGDRLGIYKKLAEVGPCDESTLAEAAGLDARYLREWLSNQAACGYITYDPASAHFSMSPEQVAVLADPDSPVSMIGGYYSLASTYFDEPKIAEAFKSGRGVDWGEHHECLFCGTEKFFRPGYAANLVANWLPALDGVKDKLEAGGARVADVGCGYGASTYIMAQAFPGSEFIGYDLHDKSVQHASGHIGDHTNISFQQATAKEFGNGGDGFDLVTIFDALHDMGDPVGACRHIRSQLRPGGTLMVVEPMAGDKLEDNLNPIGRVYYAFSTMVCTPGSRSQEVGAALGAQAGEARLGEVMREAGFSSIRRAAETPFNMILEATG